MKFSVSSAVQPSLSPKAKVCDLLAGSFVPSHRRPIPAPAQRAPRERSRVVRLRRVIPRTSKALLLTWRSDTDLFLIRYPRKWHAHLVKSLCSVQGKEVTHKSASVHRCMLCTGLGVLRAHILGLVDLCNRCLYSTDYMYFIHQCVFMW